MSERRAWVLGSGVAAVVVVVVRLVTSRGRDGYTIWPDEPAQLAIARFVGGGTPWNMHNHSVWRPLFGTLLAPVYWFTDDPVTVFHTALALNAVLGGIAAVLLVFIARRLTPMTVWWCVALAITLSLVPAVLFTTNFIFAESLVAPLYLATLLALLHFHARPTVRTGVTTAVLAATSFGAHSRMLPVVLVTLGVVALAALRGRFPLREAAVVAGVAAVSVWLVSAYSGHLVDRLWNDPSTRNSIDGVADQVTNGTAVVVSLVGQTWYLLVSTLGVVVYGAVSLARSALARSPGVAPTGADPTGADPTTRDDARLVLVTFGACAALSVVFMSDRWRSDQLVYGRYNDAVVTPIVLVGLAVVVGAIAQRRLVAISAITAMATLGAGATLWTLRRDVLTESNGLEPMILGLQPFVTSATSIDVLRISGWAAALIVALAAMSGAAAAAVRRGAPARMAITVPVVMLVAIGGFVALGTTRTARILDRSWNVPAGAWAVAELRNEVLTDGVPVDFLLPAGSNATNRMMLYQFHLPRTDFTVVSAPSAGSSPYLFAQVDGADDATDELRASGATMIWRDPRGRYGLWAR